MTVVVTTPEVLNEYTVFFCNIALILIAKVISIIKLTLKKYKKNILILTAPSLMTDLLSRTSALKQKYQT